MLKQRVALVTAQRVERRMRSSCWLAFLGGLAPASAAAWTVSETVELAVPEEVRAVAAGSWDGGPIIAVTGGQGSALLDPATGQVLRSTSAIGNDIVLVDLDQNGSQEVLICGPQGVALVRATRAVAAPPLMLTSLPCERLRTYDVGPYSALMTGTGQTVTSWVPETGGLVGTVVVDDLGGPALVATEGERAAMAGAGARVLHVLGGADIELGGVILDLAPHPAGWWVVVGGEATSLVLVGVDGAPIPLDPAPEAVRAVALDPRGGQHLALLDAGSQRVGLLDSTGHLGWLQVPVAPHFLAAADLDGDGCGELVVVGRGGQGAVVGGDCDGALPVTQIVGSGAGWSTVGGMDEAASPLVEPEVASEVAPSPTLPPEALLPPQPNSLTLDDGWKAVHAEVGQTMTLRIGDGRTNRARVFRSRGGPPGFAALADGTVEFEPEVDDVGTWRVSVRMTGAGQGTRWNGFLLHVHPGAVSEATLAASASVDSDSDSDSDSDDGPVEAVQAVRAVPKRVGPPKGFRECQLGFGVAGGAAKAGGPTFQELGQPEVRGAVSPIVQMQCLGTMPGPFGWFAGFDTAPFFEYAALPSDRTHVFGLLAGVDVGGPRVTAGLFGTVGLGLRPSPGLRTQVRPFGTDKRPAGVEVRATWLAPSLGGEFAALWIVRL